jgi:hypothetical protein
VPGELAGGSLAGNDSSDASSTMSSGVGSGMSILPPRLPGLLGTGCFFGSFFSRSSSQHDALRFRFAWQIGRGRLRLPQVQDGLDNFGVRRGVEVQPLPGVPVGRAEPREDAVGS